MSFLSRNVVFFPCKGTFVIKKKIVLHVYQKTNMSKKKLKTCLHTHRFLSLKSSCRACCTLLNSHDISSLPLGISSTIAPSISSSTHFSPSSFLCFLPVSETCALRTAPAASSFEVTEDIQPYVGFQSSEMCMFIIQIIWLLLFAKTVSLETYASGKALLTNSCNSTEQCNVGIDISLYSSPCKNKLLCQEGGGIQFSLLHCLRQEGPVKYIIYYSVLHWFIASIDIHA